MSKIFAAVLDGVVKEILAAVKDPKTKRRFLESVELQIGLKNLDPSVRFDSIIVPLDCCCWWQ
jgi:ribosomal protein L1